MILKNKGIKKKKKKTFLELSPSSESDCNLTLLPGEIFSSDGYSAFLLLSVAGAGLSAFLLAACFLTFPLHTGRGTNPDLQRFLSFSSSALICSISILQLIRLDLF